MQPSILSHCFANGLVLVAEPIASLQSAALTFLVPAGCANDPADRSGLSGFTCEMALRGAGDRDSRQFIIAMDNLGIERSEAVTSAHTSYCGATVAENLPAMLDVFTDLIRRPHLPADQLEAGRQLCLHELRAVEDEPAQKVMNELRRRFYPDPWGRPTQGELEAIEAITIDDIADHFERCYRPNGAILGVAGRFDWAMLKDQVEGLLGAWKPQTPAEVVEKPVKCRYVHLPYDSNQTQIGIAYPSVSYRHADYFQAWGAVGILGSGSGARLFTEVRERRGLCYSISAMYHTLRDRGGVFCYAGTSADRAQETLDVTLAEIKRLGQGIEVDELCRLKARIKSALIMQQESSSARSSSVARDWYHLSRVRTLDELEREIDGLTHETINAYLEANQPTDFTIVTVGPDALTIPDDIG